ncbi:iron-containing alcohol dehydrogenase [Carnobacterium alterfunditum]|uniref:iron-containing alcohol dehydrogenase n=1 Tax=Carnobacterium alterfunditum TaxID=28230 RepID=UPI002481CAA3|nr:iron-containing alcohol dehydrogenase [Carnobacterium alterfunditum]
MNQFQDKLDQTSKRFDITLYLADFGGEETHEEVERLKKIAKEKGTDVIVGLDGGKAIDTSKTVATGHTLIVYPTIKATDAPNSHSAVSYTTDHHFYDCDYFI